MTRTVRQAPCVARDETSIASVRYSTVLYDCVTLGKSETYCTVLYSYSIRVPVLVSALPNLVITRIQYRTSTSSPTVLYSYCTGGQVCCSTVPVPVRYPLLLLATLTRPGFCQLTFDVGWVAAMSQFPSRRDAMDDISKFVFLRRILVLFPIPPIIRMIDCWNKRMMPFLRLCWPEHPSSQSTTTIFPFSMPISIPIPIWTSKHCLLPVAYRSQQVKSIDKLLSPHPPSLISRALPLLVNVNGGLC